MELLEGDPRSVGGYRLEGRLGAGGMGVVYRARSLSGRQVAVKVIRPELIQDADFRVRFRREVEAARRVSGAFTAPVVDADTEADVPWLATLFVPGPSLAERVARHGPLAVPDVRRLAAGLVEALRDIHRAGLVHRDLKPGNILLAQDGPRVIDFGISRAADDATGLTGTGLVVGTPPFMAPEQFRQGTSGPATDVFALGSVLVFAATGHGPFDGDSAHTIGFRVVYEEPDLTGLPPELESLVASCLAKDPEERAALRELTAALGEAGGGAEPDRGTLLLGRGARDPRTPDPRLPAPAPVPPVPAGPAPSSAHTPTTAPADQAATGRKPSGRRRNALAAGAAALTVAAATVAVFLTVPADGDGRERTGRGKGTGETQSASPPPSPSCPSGGTLAVGGSSVQGALMERLAAGHAEACPGSEVRYEALGSGAGVYDFAEGRTAMAVTDGRLRPQEITPAGERCESGDAVQLPIVVTPVAVVYRLDGVDSLVLDARTLAGIFQGEITEWNDAGITALNPGVTLPALEVRPFHKADASTANLTAGRYLAEAAGYDWPDAPSPTMPRKAGTALGSAEEIGTQVASADGTIALVELPAAEAMPDVRLARLDTGAPEPVPLTPESASRAVADSRVAGEDGDLSVEVNHTTSAAGAYPMVDVGYALVCDKGNEPGRLPALRSFLDYVVGEEGQRTAADLGFGPVPDALATRVRAAASRLE